MPQTNTIESMTKMKKLLIAIMALGCLSMPTLGKQTAAADTLLAAPMAGRTLEGAFLLYGNGDDRLGGSKMGFVDADIPVQITGQNGELYRAQLSSGRWAYIEKKYVDTSVAESDFSPVNTGSWSIANTGTSDRISIRLPRRLAYRSWTLLEPNTICVELYGAMDNSNWMTQRGPLGMIDYVFFQQPESDVYQVVIRLKDKRCWGYTVGYDGNSLIINVRHKPRKLQLKHLTIGLDAGHGGPYSGAVGKTGLTEKEVNLDIILRLAKLLEKEGARVVLTRDGDTGPSMAERKKIWREANVDLAVSVHNNSGGGAAASPGTSVYYKHLFDRPLAQCLHKRMLELGVNDYGLTGNFNFSLNGPTDFPNALVEALFMSSDKELAMLSEPKWRQKIAEQILKGIKDYLKAK